MILSIILGASANAVGIPFVASASAYNTVDSTTLDISKPTGVVSGDILIAFVACNTGTGSGAWTMPSGWTEVLDESSGTRVGIAYKVAGGSEPSTYTFTQALTNKRLGGVIVAYTGLSYQSIGTNSYPSQTALSITTTGSYSLLIGAFADTNSNKALTAPFGMTSAGYTYNTSNGPSLLLAHQVVQSGATGSRTTTGGADTSSVLLALTMP